MKFLLTLFTFLGLGAAMANDLDFTLINKTPFSFEAIYITASTDKIWDGNLLATGQVLTKGAKIQVDFVPSDKTPNWDMNIVDDKGLVVTFPNLNLAGKNTITLKDIHGEITAIVE